MSRYPLLTLFTLLFAEKSLVADVVRSDLKFLREEFQIIWVTVL